MTSKIIFGFFLSKFFAWQALTDLKITFDSTPLYPQSTRGYTVLRTCIITCYAWSATWPVISQGANDRRRKLNLTNTFGYLNPFYTFGGVQIIPDKNIQIVKFIFRFSFFLFFLKEIFRKNSNFWKKSKKGKWKKKFFDCLFWTDDSPRSEFEVSFSLKII